ncbi:hypothetical protein [Bradyrhizobium sp. CCBAU 53338]|uniref:hypothetical protein n=1 Tax=Bradyrhizobium sp. CCBAU 53338 TaxID=1325111 RepID=UPI00188D54D4|nr:hypothetical protein [Bradyrhizobium sp. CCBAU 53338]
MADPSISSWRRFGQLFTVDATSRWPRDGRRSRAERLEIISCVAATGMSECSAWIVPILERTIEEDPTMEKRKC